MFRRFGNVELLDKKTSEEFHKLVGSHEQVYVRCIKCGEKFLREFKNIHLLHSCPTHVVRDDGLKVKWCDGCEEYLPYSSFSADNTYDGLTYLCKGCTWPQPLQSRNFSPSVRLECKIVHEKGQLPYRKRTSDAGYDVHSVENVIIEAHAVANIDTGIIVSPPEDTYYTIEGRSSVFSDGVTPYRGIIDGTYQGLLKVMLVNNSNVPYNVREGDRIAQLVLHKIIHADFMVVNEFSPVQNGRADNGWGSSGK